MNKGKRKRSVGHLFGKFHNEGKEIIQRVSRNLVGFWENFIFGRNLAYFYRQMKNLNWEKLTLIDEDTAKPQN